jgi:hypothetical protein
MPIYEVEELDDLKAAADAAQPEPSESIKKAPTAKPAKPSKHETADALAAKFWEIHKSSTAQPFLAVRQVIRTAIGNGVPRDDVARALDRLAREGRAISGGTIQTAIAQIRNAVNGHRQQTGPDWNAAMARAVAADAQAADRTPPWKEITA